MRKCCLKLVVILFSFLASNVWALNVIEGVRVWPAPENTRVVFDLSDAPQYSFFYLTKPNRLFIDFKKAVYLSFTWGSK